MSITHFSGTVEKLVFGGDGLIRKEGLVIFVPGVVPGEEVRVEVVRRKKNFARARLVEVVRSSPERIAPRCSHFGVCGGCQLQHIHPAKHIDIKREWLREALYSIFEGDIRFIPAEDFFFWRRKITLHACVKEGAWVLGYFAPDNTTLVAINECPLFFDDFSPLVFLKKTLNGIPAQENKQLDMELFRLPSGALALKLQAPFSLAHTARASLLSALRRATLFETFALSFGSWNHAEDNFFEPIAFQALGRTCYFSLRAFVQNHVKLGDRLWGDVVNLVDQLGENQVILDLYSGVGVTAIALAERGHSVTAVEGNEEATRCGILASHELRYKPLFICNSVEKSLSEYHQKAETWVLNPPRMGVSARALQLIKKNTPEHVIYVSCSPATLARDVKELVLSGWNIQAVQGYDMFPQTTHLETVVILSRLR